MPWMVARLQGQKGLGACLPALLGLSGLIYETDLTPSKLRH